ncbi:MAG: FprA family A-type flavoprotein [Deltaproteobacteria bacterium]|jgi:flavorubredoxin|nr:FprA family A-type flavoprotein [Deltaproteobacteria bacterium]
MKPVEIKKDIYWVGMVNFASHNFHGYAISPRGTTYNCYVVKDEKNVLFDTVQADHSEDMLARLRQVIEPEKIDYIVINHVELDHAGALAEMVEVCKPEKIFCSPMGLKSMASYFDISGWPVQAVKTGEVLNIGKRNIHFVETRMLHWPDSMFSYIPEDKLLISNDAFGQNIASYCRFAHEIDEKEALTNFIEEYYFNIVLPFSSQVLKTLDLVTELKLDIDMIAPDHGVIFKGQKDVGFILNKYREMAEQKPRKKALIFYDTMWRSTETLANYIGCGLDQVGVPYRVMYLKNHHHSQIMTELAKCSAIIPGSPTHNNGIMPLVAGVLTYMKGLRPQNLVGGAFGSYGWSGESTRDLTGWLDAMKVEQPAEPVKCLFRPTKADLEAAENLGRKVGEALIAKCEK